MFKRLFGKSKPAPPPAPTAPEILGLRQDGAFELDDLRLRLIEPNLVVAKVARTHLIQAVGVVPLDETSRYLRYYTDDEGYCQVLLTGGTGENNVSDVKLWYFYETSSVGSEADWNRLLEDQISKPTYELEGHTWHRVWEGTGDASPPVAMTETTFSEGGKASATDQFAMLYEREAGPDLSEYLMVTGEEKIIDNRADRCLVISTGIDLQPADIDIIG